MLSHRDPWIKFYWDLKNLPEYTPQLRQGMRLQTFTGADLTDIWQTIKHAYEMDSSWNVGLKEYLDTMLQAMRKGAKEGKLIFAVLEDGKRPIGVSVLQREPVNGSHFLTGVCIQNEYRCRGYGTALLHYSLKLLSEAHLTEACAIARSRSTGARFLYPKFGSKPESSAQAAALPSPPSQPPSSTPEEQPSLT